MSTSDIIDLFIQATKDKQSFKQLQSELIDYFTNTPVSIIISNLETLIEFLNQLKKKVITFTILYDEELTNIIDNIDEFHLYLKSIYTKQEQTIKNITYNKTETEEMVTENLKKLTIYTNILLEQDEENVKNEQDQVTKNETQSISELDTENPTDQDENKNIDQEVNTPNDNTSEQQNTNDTQIVITPNDIPEEISDNNTTTSQPTENMIYYELTLIDLLQYNFNLEYIKQFIKDLTNLITIIMKLEKQEIEKLHL